MAIYGQLPSEISTKDLEELLANNAVENVRLEFKREIPSKDETLKKLSSFANTFGGTMVIGAEANSADGRLTGLPGVEPKAGFKQTIVQWCFTGSYPPLSVEVSDPISAPGENGRVCYVLSVAESEIGPHFLNDRKGVYVRTDEFSAHFEPRLATENELRSLFDRRRLVQERRAALIDRARRRFESFESRELPQNESARVKITGGARMELSVIPHFPVVPICDHARLQQLVTSLAIPWRGTSFPGMRMEKISQHESMIVLWPGETFSMLEANVWGLSFFASELRETRQDFQGIHLSRFTGQLLVFLKYSAALLSSCGYEGALRIDLRMRGMKGVHWVHFRSDVPETGPASELDNEIAFSLQAQTIHSGDQIATNILRGVFFATNWAALAGDDSGLSQAVRKGYKFNLWPEPV